MLYSPNLLNRVMMMSRPAPVKMKAIPRTWIEISMVIVVRLTEHNDRDEFRHSNNSEHDNDE